MRSSSVRLPHGLLVSSFASAVVLGAVACGDKPTAPVAPPPPPSASAEAAKPPVNKALLGHWSTGDGSVGLVIDRTGDIAKVKIDKSNDIVQITPKEDRKHGDLVGNRYESPDGKGVLYITVGGHVKFYGPKDTFDLRRDADAEALGAPTVAGVPAPPKKMAYELLIEELDAISVVKKLGFKAEDSGNLAKVGEAIEKADKGLFVTYQAKTDAATFAPAPETIGGTTYAGATGGGYPLEDDNKDKIGPFGGVLRGWTTDTGGGYIRLYTPKKKILADKTPGLVWEAGSTSVVFVTLDGGRYRVDVSHQTVEAGAPLAKGIAPTANWPAAIQDSIYDTSATQYLAKSGAIPATVHEQAEKIDEEWRACANKEAKALQDKLDKAGTNRRKILEGHLPATRKKCAASEKKMVKLLTDFADARNKERTALYEKSKTKLK